MLLHVLLLFVTMPRRKKKANLLQEQAAFSAAPAFSLNILRRRAGKKNG
jgi:hypothetical protein